MNMGLQIFDTRYLAEMVAHGFTMARFDAQHLANPAQFVNEILAIGLRPLMILREVDQLDHTPEGVDVELGNEPDLEHEGWDGCANYAQRAVEFVERSRGRHKLWFGAVSNLNARGFRFLRGLPWSAWDASIGCSFHRYPEGTDPWRSHYRRNFPWQPIKTRDDEMQELRSIVGDRPIGMSETGYNRMDSTEAEQAQSMAYEREFFEKHGCDFAVAYQINSAPGDPVDIPESYGFRREDGRWLPVTEAWTA